MVQFYPSKLLPLAVSSFDYEHGKGKGGDE